LTTIVVRARVEATAPADAPNLNGKAGRPMGIFDKAKDALSEHSAQVDAGIDKAGDFADDKTGGKYAEHVDRAQAFAKEKLADSDGDPDQPESTPEQPI
jgi:hypothetical protein